MPVLDYPGLSALDALVATVLRDTGCPASAPVPVHRIARQLGLTVRTGRIPGARGVLRVEDGRPVIVLAYQLRSRRARFTLAHELGHWITAAYPSETGAVWAQDRLMRDQERFSNTFAAALLLPASWTQAFLKDAKGDEPNIEILLRLAAVAEVSPHAAIIRAVAIGRWRRLLAQIHRTGTSWRILATSGYPALWGRLGQLMQPDSVVSIRQKPSADWLVLSGSGWSVDVPGQLRRRGPSAWLCLAPDKARRTRRSVHPPVSRSRSRTD